jgi:hypothetical protein
MDGERPEYHLSVPRRTAAGLENPTSMNTKDLIVDYDTQSEKVEHVCKIVPNIRVPVFPRTFRVEAVRLGDPS